MERNRDNYLYYKLLSLPLDSCKIESGFKHVKRLLGKGVMIPHICLA